MSSDVSAFAAAFLGLFVAHHAADYLFQSDCQSARKAAWTEGPEDPAPGRHHHGWGANQVHASIHTASSLIVLGVLAVTVGLPLSLLELAAALVWVHVTHSLIDRRWPVRWWMTHTGSGGFVDRGGMPLVDQAMHLVVGVFPAAVLVAL
ncbi:DUF3307 domain-containing protein [Streptomyces sp. AJS327]|uniref:DUF3307 domain-containing protein n=1 Tax=Streptomyces sp. AJS327 TaxID=2545265 RepID=UPI0015DF5C46|nr:DUF3307 domain-containing protein [Streptomyces sp. AJS327]MBA0054028.1 DUF3307 domain-containing protein [Streptomyces sp. AJS327]